MTRNSVLAFGIPLALLTGLLSWKAQQQPVAPDIDVARPQLHCTVPPTFHIGYQREPNGVAQIGRGFDFQGVAWIEADLCSPGVLQLTAAGQAANGEDPILQVALNSETLASAGFHAPRSLNIRVPRPGRLTLGYFNDFYKADARVATIEHLGFVGPRCTDIQVDVPRATGGQWTPSTGTASLVSSVPMTVTPCSAGTLSLRVLGRTGANVYPILEIRQRGNLLSSVHTGANLKSLQVLVSAQPVTITLTNPYFKQLADRNLQLLSLQYNPDRNRAP